MPTKKNSLRIIGGQFRGRRFSFPELPSIRPTPDRVRETLFNWLQYSIVDSVCVDLFCGSGALGLEAISRGANYVYAYDIEKKVVENLENIAATLHLTNYKITQQDIPFELTLEKNSVDIIFLDPPFRKDLVSVCLDWIEVQNILKPNGFIYLETEKNYDTLSLKPWKILKEKFAGQVCYRLLKKQSVI